MKTVRLTEIFKNQNSRRNVIVGVVVAVAILMVGYGVLFLRAAGFFASVEGEQATLSGNARLISDSSASGGTAVQFTAPPSPTPTPTPPPPPPSSGGRTCPAYPAFPDASCTGVPAGTSLTAYSGCSGGEAVIATDNTVIDSKTFGTAGSHCDVAIRAHNVVIKNSLINGTIGTPEETNYSFSLIDSEVDAGVIPAAAVGSANITITRANVHGGETSIYCWANCTITDSWVHGQGLDPNQPWHLGGILANDNGAYDGKADTPGALTNLTATHNRLACDTPSNKVDGGCSGDLNMFGDFGTIRHIRVDRNLFVAATTLAYCTYGGSANPGGKPYPNATDVSYTNNIFQRGSNNQCGGYGPAAGFNINGTGNVWTNNVWDNGGAVTPDL